jgi:5-methylcytosine-specific restriction endonuclease McrA
MIEYDLLYEFSKKMLNLDPSVRWMGIANKFGVLLNAEHREGLEQLMTDEENEEYAALTVTRHKTRIKFQPKIGDLTYAVGKYEKVIRATIRINTDYFLLLTLDVDAKDYDSLLVDKVIPLVKERKNEFVDKDLSVENEKTQST